MHIFDRGAIQSRRLRKDKCFLSSERVFIRRSLLAFSQVGYLDKEIPEKMEHEWETLSVICKRKNAAPKMRF